MKRIGWQCCYGPTCGRQGSFFLKIRCPLGGLTHFGISSTPVTNIAHDIRATCFADKGAGLFGPRMSQALIKYYVVIAIKMRMEWQCCYGVIFLSQNRDPAAQNSLFAEKNKKVRGGPHWIRTHAIETRNAELLGVLSRLTFQMLDLHFNLVKFG